MRLDISGSAQSFYERYMSSYNTAQRSEEECRQIILDTFLAGAKQSSQQEMLLLLEDV